MTRTASVLALSFPLGCTWIGLSLLLCVASVWVCRIAWPLDLSQVLRPFLLVAAVATLAAACVLAANLAVIEFVRARAGWRRWGLLALLGGLTGLAPRLLWGLFHSPGLEGLDPQLEFLPFFFAGVLFIFIQGALTGGKQNP